MGIFQVVFSCSFIYIFYVLCLYGGMVDIRVLRHLRLLRLLIYSYGFLDLEFLWVLRYYS